MTNLEDVKKTIGLALRWYRQKSGMSMSDLAEQSGVQRSTISRIELNNSRYMPTISSLVLLCNVLDLPITDLFNYTPS